MSSPRFFNDLRERWTLTALFLFCTLTSLAGPVRMYFSMVGLTPLIYIPNLMMLIAVGWQLVADPGRHGFSALTLISLITIGYAAVVGFMFLPTIQVAMGFYVLLPFWFGLAGAPLFARRWGEIQRFIGPSFFVAAGGVILNQVVEYPWEGFGYSVGDLDVEGSRQWYANGGVKRLAGFSRASFDAAVQVQVLGILAALNARSATLRTIIWITTIVAVYPTNSKGIMLVWLVLSPVILFKGWLPESPQRVMPAFFASLGLALPMSTLLFTYNSQFSNPTLAALTYSFYDRLNYMWPEAWHLVGHYGNILMGRGIGSIGTAQTYFEPSMFNAGDNVFMYWFVIFGFGAFPGFVLLLLRSLRLRPYRDPGEMRIFCLLMAVLVYGSMANVVENAVFALVCGIVVRWLGSGGLPRQERS